MAIVGLLLSPEARAEPLSVRDLLARLEESPRLEVLRARVDRARAEVSAAGVLPNPSISVDREEVEKNPEHFVRLLLPLEISGRRGKRVEAREAGLAAAEAESDREALLLRLEAIAIYFATVAARSRVDAVESARNAIAGRVDQVRSRASAGEVSGFDLGWLELEVHAADDLLDEERAELLAHHRALAAMAGAPHATFDPTDAITSTVPPLARMIEGALAARSDYRAAKNRRRGAELELSAAARGWVPSIVLSGGLKTAEEEEDTRFGYLAGIGFSIPVFDHGQGGDERALADRREAGAEMRMLELEVPAAIARAHETLRIHVERMKRFEQSILPHLNDLIRRADAAHREGELPVIELVEAYRTARDMRLRHADLLLRAKRSELDLWREVGRLPDEVGRLPEDR